MVDAFQLLGLASEDDDGRFLEQAAEVRAVTYACAAGQGFTRAVRGTGASNLARSV